MQFAAGIGRGLHSDHATAAKALVSSFQGLTRHKYMLRSALVLTDALAGHADDLVEQLTRPPRRAGCAHSGGAGPYGARGRGAGEWAKCRLSLSSTRVPSLIGACIGALRWRIIQEKS
jgi:hypothetical protein